MKSISQPSWLTLFIQLESFSGFVKAVHNAFGRVLREAKPQPDKLRLIFLDDTDMTFTLFTSPEKLQKEAGTAAGYLMKIPSASPAIKAFTLQKVLGGNCIVRAEFQRNADLQRTHALTDGLFQIAHTLDGLLLFPNGQFYDGQGRLVLSADGKSDLKEDELPTGGVSPS